MNAIPNPDAPPDLPAEVYLHMGAHRTGTTSFQYTLGHNAGALAQQGLTVWIKSRGQIPNGRPTHGITNALNKHADGEIGRPKAVARLTRWIRKQPDFGAQSVLMSDENFLGDMRGFFAGDGLYRGAGARCAVFADLFGPRLKRVTVVIRPLLGWIGSGAGYYALSGTVYPNADLIRLAGTETRGWADIVGEMRDALPETPLVVVDYKARGDDGQLAARFCPDARLSQIAAARNASIAATQMQQLQTGDTAGGQKKFAENDPAAEP